MSSVLARTKQIPTDSQYFVSLTSTGLNLEIFNEDAAASTTSYVSGAAAGNFTQSNVVLGGFDVSGGSVKLFRDMGVTIMSSGRTFRAVQYLLLDGNAVTHAGGQTGWTSSTSGSPGVWQAGIEGVTGGPSTNSATAGSSFNVFYFETGARGLGIAQGLVRYG
jgi:hypothetical protein